MAGADFSAAFCLQVGKKVVGPFSEVAETPLSEELLSAHSSLSPLPCLEASGQGSLQSHLELSNFSPSSPVGLLSVFCSLNESGYFRLWTFTASLAWILLAHITVLSESSSSFMGG